MLWIGTENGEWGAWLAAEPDPPLLQDPERLDRELGDLNKAEPRQVHPGAKG
jgi:hypothetical protein